MLKQLYRFSRLLALAILALFLTNCGSTKNKSKASIENIKFCEDPGDNNICTDHNSSFAAGITRIYASADISLKGKNGNFEATWYRVTSSLQSIGHKTIPASEEGTGKLAVDIIETGGFPAGNYRLEISFANEESEGKASSDFTVVD